MMEANILKLPDGASSQDQDSVYPEPDAKTLKEQPTSIYIGMSVSWLRQARMSQNPNAPPHLKIGKSVRYLKSDLDTWLAAMRQH